MDALKLLETVTKNLPNNLVISGGEGVVKETASKLQKSFNPIKVKITYEDTTCVRNIIGFGVSYLGITFGLALIDSHENKIPVHGNNIRKIEVISTPSYRYYLAEAGYNPNTQTQWYDLIKARDWDEAEKLSESKGYGEVLDELSNNFRQAIGELVYDRQYPTYAIKPLALRSHE